MKVTRYITLIIAYFMWIGTSYAQHYIAKDGSGELRLIDESRYEISFYSISGVDSEPNASFFDTGYYRIEKDTMYLSSLKHSWADVAITYDTSGLERVDAPQYLIQNLGVNKEGKWFEHYKYLVRDAFCKGDTIILYCPIFLCRNCILSVYDNHIQRRIIPDEKLFFSFNKEKSFYLVIYPDKVDRIYLNGFPLLIRNKKLIPVDKYKNFECFIHNGFVFPKMDQRERTMQKMGVMCRGIRGQEIYR